MAAKIKILGHEATVTEGVWTSDNHRLAIMLNANTANLLITPPSYVPNLDLFIAEEIIKDFGGEVISFDEVEIEDGLVY